MKINKDLVDAVMMISFISLVLVGTSDFDSAVMKSCTMGALGFVTVCMVVLRVLHAKQEANKPKEEE